MKLKFNALVLVASMFAVPAFAADFSTANTFSDITTADTADNGTIVTEINLVLAATTDAVSPAYDGNVTLIGQIGSTGNVALVSQTGTANFVGVVQDSTNIQNATVAIQNGANNKAVVSQK